MVVGIVLYGSDGYGKRNEEGKRNKKYVDKPANVGRWRDRRIGNLVSTIKPHSKNHRRFPDRFISVTFRLLFPPVKLGDG